MASAMRINVDEAALSDPRIKRLGRLLDVSHGDAFLAICRVWCAMYNREGGAFVFDEIDLACDIDGMGRAMIAAGLAEETPEGVRCKGSERAAWVRSRREAARTGGEARARTAIRTGGQFGNAEYSNQRDAGVVTSQTPATHQPNTSEATSPLVLVLAPVLEKENTLSGKPDCVSVRKAEAAKGELAAYLEWFNREFQRDYRANEFLLKSMRASLAKGYSQKPDMRLVSAFLADKWLPKPEMADYVKPSTLLRPATMDKWIDDAKSWYQQRRGGAL